jgi:hypothetical protein
MVTCRFGRLLDPSALTTVAVAVDLRFEPTEGDALRVATSG